MEYISGEIKQIGPETARDMLEHVDFEFQRKLSKAHVKHLAEIIGRGEFFTGHIVIASVPGGKRVANGQHTLHAIALSMCPIRCLTERYKCGDDAEYLKLFHAFDTENRKRSYRDSAKAFLMSGAAGDIPVNSDLLNLFRAGLECRRKLTSGWRTGRGQVVTRYDRFSEAFSNDAELAFFCELDKGKDCREVLHRAGIIAAIIATHQENRCRAKSFWNQVVSGWFDCDKANDNFPARRLNRFLRSHKSASAAQERPGTKSMTQRQIYTACITCWNAFIQCRDIAIIRTVTNGRKIIQAIAS